MVWWYFMSSKLKPWCIEWVLKGAGVKGGRPVSMLEVAETSCWDMLLSAGWLAGPADTAWAALAKWLEYNEEAIWSVTLIFKISFLRWHWNHHGFLILPKGSALTGLESEREVMEVSNLDPAAVDISWWWWWEWLLCGDTERLSLLRSLFLSAKWN